MQQPGFFLFTSFTSGLAGRTWPETASEPLLPDGGASGARVPTGPDAATLGLSMSVVPSMDSVGVMGDRTPESGSEGITVPVD